MAVADAVERVADHVSGQRLAETAGGFVGVPSPTGSELEMARLMRRTLAELGMDVAWQEVEDDRPNVVGTLEGAGGGPSLMLCGHMDTSYSGAEPDVAGIGFRPEPTVRDGRLWGLGITNMKGALACYVEAARALSDAGVRLRGDLIIGAVVGEIEKAQWGEEFRGREYRGYGAGSRALPLAGTVPDFCLLGEPTEQRIVLGHCGALWARISTRGPFMHTAFSAGRLGENAIVRLQDVLGAVREWIPTWEQRAGYRGMPGVVNIGAVRGGYPWRLSRTPSRGDLFLDVRVPPAMRMQEARAAVHELVGSLRERYPEHGIEWEVYLTAPGAEIDPGHELVGAIDAGHRSVFGAPPERDQVRWFSDASALTRYGIETVNYGSSSSLPGPDGESLGIEEMADTARVYALAAARACGVST